MMQNLMNHIDIRKEKSCHRGLGKSRKVIGRFVQYQAMKRMTFTDYSYGKNGGA